MHPREVHRPSRAPIVAALVAGVEAARIGFIAHLPDGRFVQNLPDDAFYYLQAARNFARHGHWTFDGIEPSSGFHLLWGYLLAACFRIHPGASLHQIFILGSVIQSLCLALAAFLVTKTAERIAGPTAFGGVMLIFLSAVSLQQGTWMMETSFVIVCAAGTLYLLARMDLKLTPRLLAISFALGVLVSLSRSDSGLLALLLCIAHLYAWKRGVSTRAMVITACTVLAGAGTGLALVFLQTYWISGQWIQASATQKVFWTTIVGRSFGSPLHIIYNFFNPLYNAAAPFTAAERFLDRHLHPIHHLYPVVAAIVVLFLAVIAIGVLTRVRSNLVSGTGPILFASTLTVIGYIFFYRQVSAAIQPWYIGNFEAPMALLAGVGFAGLLNRRYSFGATVLGLMCLSGIGCSFVAPNPWAEAMWRAGVYLREHRNLRPTGAWNAGIVGYYSDSGVTNLDGLMNDSILPYARRGDLQDYIAQRGITYIIDSPQMWNQNSSSLGGYANGRLQRCIVGDKDLFPEDPYNNFGYDHIRLYTLNPDCLRNTGP